MDRKKYIIYCDESERKGKIYSDFFGGLLVLERNIEKINNELNLLRNELNYVGELKWSKICNFKVNIYDKVIDYIFQKIHSGDIKVRIFFRKNTDISTQQLTANHKSNTYFFLYNQFLRHHFGLKYCKQCSVRIFADTIPDNNKDKINDFKRWVCKAFNDQNIILKDDHISEIDSKNHDLLQTIDIFLGAIQFRLNDKHLERDGNGKIGKKTKAKIEIYKKINTCIRSLPPEIRYKCFNIGVNTGMEEKEDLFNLPWRHWSFKPY